MQETKVKYEIHKMYYKARKIMKNMTLCQILLIQIWQKSSLRSEDVCLPPHYCHKLIFKSDFCLIMFWGIRFTMPDTDFISEVV